jgi:hypothetical protein
LELLLNLAWLLLAVPAYWLWQRQKTSARAARHVTSLQCLLALGCVLVLLFPVISASDDLHAMRAEMEESSSSKRAVRHAGGDRNSVSSDRWQAPAMAASAAWLWTPMVTPLEIASVSLSPLTRPAVLPTGRAPPVPLLS